MGAWGKSLDAAGASGVRFLADPSGAFTKEWDLIFPSAAVFGNDRSKRYAVVVDGGKVKSVHVEPDNTGVKGTFTIPFPSHSPFFSLACPRM